MRTSYGVIFASLLCAFTGLDRAGAAEMTGSLGNEMVMPPAVLPKDRLFDLFAHACVDGSVMLKPEEAQPMSLPKIPHVLHQWYSDTTNLRVYKLIADRASYLILFDGKPGKYNYKSGCALATSAYDFRALWLYAVKRPYWRGGDKGLLRKFDFTVPNQKYTIEAQDVGDFGIVQISMLSDFDADQRMAVAAKQYDAYRKLHPNAPAADMKQ